MRKRKVAQVGMQLELVHRTRYWGRDITPQEDDKRDSGSPVGQAISSEEPHCCRGFGPRWVQIDGELLKEIHSDAWCLWHVDWRQGRNADHLFHDFVLAPDSPSMDQHAQYRNWTYVGHGAFRNGMGILQAKLPYYMQRWHTEARDVYGEFLFPEGSWADLKVHCHIGIHLPEDCVGIDTKTDRPVWE